MQYEHNTSKLHGSINTKHNTKRKRLGLVYKELRLSIMLMIRDYILT